MRLLDFLERDVDGYLFEDLNSMAAVRLPSDKCYGGVGYPMVMTALAGVELLGALTSGDEFKTWKHGDRRFCKFWRDYLYPNEPARQEVDQLVYSLVRNGLAHTYMTKGTIIVSKSCRGDHLCRDNSGQRLFVDAIALFAPDEPNVYGGMVRYVDFESHKLTAVGKLRSHQFGWELLLLIGSQHEVVQSQVCRTQDDVLTTGEQWKAAMIDKGWA
jgi:hypothetical protein